jgi:hypothetical protein
MILTYTAPAVEKARAKELNADLEGLLATVARLEAHKMDFAREIDEMKSKYRELGMAAPF